MGIARKGETCRRQSSLNEITVKKKKKTRRVIPNIVASKRSGLTSIGLLEKKMRRGIPQNHRHFNAEIKLQ
jgi:hypothetical protein